MKRRTKAELFRDLSELVHKAAALEASERQYRLAMAALQASENKYRTLVENIPQKIFHKDRNSVYVSCNENYARDMRIEPDQIAGKTDFDFYPPDMAVKYIADDQRVMRQGATEEIEETYVHNGEEMIVHTVKTPIRDSQGNVVGILGIFRDITARKRAEEELQRYREHLEELVKDRTEALRAINEQLQMEIAERKRIEEELRRSEAKYRTMYETAGTAIILIGEDSAVSLANTQFERLSGYSKRDVEGMLRWLDFVDEEDRSTAIECYQRCLGDGSATSQSCEVRFRDRSGGLHHVLMNMSAIPETKQTIASILDITQRKQMEEALRESEKKYSTLVENSLTGIYINQEGKIAFANQRFAEIYGYCRKEILGIDAQKLVHPADRTMVAEISDRRLRGEEVPSEYEARGLTRNGETIWVNRKNTRITYNGRPAILGNVADVTSSKTLAKALQESEAKLRNLSARLLKAQEQERRRISLELHDELGQALTVLKLTVRSIDRKTREGSAIRRECKEALKQIDQIIENVRRLSRDLCPSMLKGLGLWAAIRSLVEDFTQHSGISISLAMRDIRVSFSEDAQPMIYRILQESLTNVGKHAQASRVNIAIQERNGGVLFVVRDDGVGFDAERMLARRDEKSGIGLATMNERARTLGGFLNIWSKEGRGTRISFWIPAEEGGAHAGVSHSSSR